MTKGNKYIIWLVLILFLAGAAACKQDRLPCLTPKIASLNLHTVRITSHADTTKVDTVLQSATFIAITNSGNKGIIYPPQASFTLSLSSVADSCQWAVAADTVNLNYDTLTFHYSRNLQFISNACGFAYFYNLTDVRSTHHFIDSLRITNINVTNNVNTSHLQVFIHPNF